MKLATYKVYSVAAKTVTYHDIDSATVIKAVLRGRRVVALQRINEDVHIRVYDSRSRSDMTYRVNQVTPGDMRIFNREIANLIERIEDYA